MARHLRLGEAGEEMAAAHLRKQGLRIIGQRVRMGRLELDIVARQGREWVFVEVKTRSTGRFGKASEGVTPGKSARLRRAVEEYIRRNGLEREPIRCDLVAIDLDGEGEAAISHFKGIEL